MKNTIFTADLQH